MFEIVVGYGSYLRGDDEHDVRGDCKENGGLCNVHSMRIHGVHLRRENWNLEEKLTKL